MKIPRYQSVLFIFLLVASVAMGMILWQLRERAHRRLVTSQDSTPTQAPVVAPTEQATLVVANDADGSLLAQTHSLPLPKDPGSRARAILGKLLDLYSAPGAIHAVPGGANSVAQVFLMPAINETANATPQPASSLPGSPVKAMQRSADTDPDSPQLAVVNLSGAFAAGHPSGLETETLTVLSICSTLHANLPRVTEVRFLVDGQQRATLAGHADLTRTYLTTDAVPAEGAQP